MKVTHKIDDFLLELFPRYKKSNLDLGILKEEITKYFTVGPYKPKVSIEGDWISIEVDTEAIADQRSNYNKAIALCEKGKYQQAKPILLQLIEKNPSISEYHRIMGQIISDEGDQEEAINYLIDALRWDAKNGSALLMMGNIFGKFKEDITTAVKYYDQAILANATDHISFTNIGYLLFQQGKYDEAKKYLWEAIKINNEFPNTHFTLALIAEKEGDLHSGFYSVMQAISHSTEADVLYNNAVKWAFEVAHTITANPEGKKIFTEYKHKLEFEGDREIDIVEDATIDTPAKIEFAENYNRTKHIIKYKPGYPAVEHLIMHELVHLDFVIQARKEDLNQIFISTQQQKAAFIKQLDPTVKKFRKLGISDEATQQYCESLFTGLNSQVFNAPVDLFIEDFLFHQFPELRPYQFISLHALLQESIKAVTDKKIVQLSPPDILTKSKIYNVLSAFQFNMLYGIQTVKQFRPNPAEHKQAIIFFEEYRQYREDRKPAEEYELLLHWAEDLKLHNNFELVDENEYRNRRTDIDNLIASIEDDPLGSEASTPFKDRQMDKFHRSQETTGLNMAVVLYMQGALSYFKDLPAEKVKAIALEIAMLGTDGISPARDDYKLDAFPGKIFSGYQILAWYYVSFKLALPEMVDQLGLNYEKEYKMAANEI